ncbi:prostatic acid phosphatase isoform X2 [Bicyclus anynana]|uniref:acid phosphatase n=1 Tax=Bicyclus anynana TaxID=110368 RepID=A0A6J1N1A7_BICAN|nr:prostatic acid phosphatase isoform X2 [Bicyclus anynana]XP_052746437.1 prostatic acid phosphatase isoform X2 [Bicyclus anynana]
MDIFLVLLLLMPPAYGEKTIKYAAVIYRHGDRTTVDSYPNDPWKDESLWPEPFGQLTNTGKRQHYKFGKWLRVKYPTLISEKYDAKEVYIRSTDVDRTLMSAQANAAGMYPPSGDAVWNPNLLWQPIPVHTLPEKWDQILAMKRKCVPYDQEKQRYMNSVTYKEKLEKYQSLMEYTTVNSGKKIKNFEDINDIYNILYVETLYNFSLPKWTTAVYPEKLREPACYSFKVATATPLMSRLMVGPLLQEIVGKMKMIIKGLQPLKLAIYSGHDFTIGNILNSIGVYDGNCPVYTATIIFELLEDVDTNEYFIRMLYRNSIELIEPVVIYIPRCGKLCKYQRFIELYENLLTVDWDHECEKQILPTLGIASVVGIVIFVVIVKKLYSRRMHESIYSAISGGDKINKSKIMKIDPAVLEA